MSASPPSGFLSRVPLSKLTAVRVAVRRANITTCHPPGPIERSIEDSTQLMKIIHHVTNDETRNSIPIFNRDDVLVNQVEILPLAENNRLDEQKSLNRSTSQSPKNECASSSNEEISRSRSSSLNKEKDVRIILDSRRKESLSRETGSLNRDENKINLERRNSSDKDNRRNLDKENARDQRRCTDGPYSMERNKYSNRRRSKTPLRIRQYRPNEGDMRRRTRSKDKEHPHEKYRHHSRRSRSLSQKRYKSQTPEYQKPSTSRKSSRSPESHSSEKIRRERSPSRYKRERRTSRSSNEYPQECNSRSSSVRHERYSRRQSRSPSLYDGERDPQKKRGRSSKSPHSSTISRSDHRKSNRSPSYERDNSRSKKYRSRTRTPTKRRSRSLRRHQERDFAFFEGIPSSDCWIPAPIRPGFPGMHRFYPPAFYPRLPSAPIILPPRFPVVAPYPPFAQRLPIYNGRPRFTTSTNSVTEATTATATGGNKDDDIAIQKI